MARQALSLHVLVSARFADLERLFGEGNRRALSPIVRRDLRPGPAPRTT